MALGNEFYRKEITNSGFSIKASASSKEYHKNRTIQGLRRWIVLFLASPPRFQSIFGEEPYVFVWPRGSGCSGGGKIISAIRIGGCNPVSQKIVVTIDSALCEGCKECIEGCPVGVFGIKDGKAVVVDMTLCGDCRYCESVCRTGAVCVCYLEAKL